MDVAFEPVSLGERCEVKFQISRHRYFRRFPERSEAAFRLTLMGPTLGSHMFGWELFDWQSASIESVCIYLERDFQGVFEREDLCVENNEVVHRTLHTNHMHEFENIRRDGIVQDEMIDTAYAGVRRKFDRLVDKFRQQLEAPGDFLYICTDIQPEPQVRRLIKLLEARSPEHRVHLLLVPHEDQQQIDLSALAPQVTVTAVRPQVVDKAQVMVWEGDDAAWDKALAPFNLNLDFGAAKPAGKADEEASAPRGLLSRLFSR